MEYKLDYKKYTERDFRVGCTRTLWLNPCSILFKGIFRAHDRREAPICPTEKIWISRDRSITQLYNIQYQYQKIPRYKNSKILSFFYQTTQAIQVKLNISQLWKGNSAGLRHMIQRRFGSTTNRSIFEVILWPQWMFTVMSQMVKRA